MATPAIPPAGTAPAPSQAARAGRCHCPCRCKWARCPHHAASLPGCSRSRRWRCTATSPTRTTSSTNDRRRLRRDRSACRRHGLENCHAGARDQRFATSLARHRWAIGLMESRRRPGPSNLRHHDAVIGKLRAAGFDIAMAAHAYSLLDSYIYGFAITKMNLPFDTSAEVVAVAQDILEPFTANEYPNLVEFITEHAMKPGYDYGDEFEYGLDRVPGQPSRRFGRPPDSGSRGRSPTTIKGPSG